MASLTRSGPTEIKTAAVEATADGANEVIAGVTGKTIVVVGLALTCTAEGTITFKGSTTKAKFNVAKQGGLSFAGSTDCPLFIVSAGTALSLENPAGVDTLGCITYVLGE